MAQELFELFLNQIITYCEWFDFFFFLSRNIFFFSTLSFSVSLSLFGVCSRFRSPNGSLIKSWIAAWIRNIFWYRFCILFAQFSANNLSGCILVCKPFDTECVPALAACRYSKIYRLWIIHRFWKHVQQANENDLNWAFWFRLFICLSFIAHYFDLNSLRTKKKTIYECFLRILSNWVYSCSNISMFRRH